MRFHNFIVISFLIIKIIIEIPSAVTFGYSKRQQHVWAKEFKSCAGKLQSPIALSTQKSVILPLPALEMNGYHDFLTCPLSLKNNGHSVALNFDKNLSRKTIPYVFGAMLQNNRKYEIEGLHFHWGRRNNRGSEHILNGVRYPMEMHIIHKNNAYSNMKEALENNDGLAVLGIFFQLQDDDNVFLKPILKNLPSIQWLDNEVRLNISMTLSSFLPKNTDTYYTYRGSLTTPPCSEAVTWIIFSTPVSISFKQMNKFRSLSNGEDILADNYRKLQDLGIRKVYLRKLTSDFASDPNLINLNMTKLEWYWQ